MAWALEICSSTCSGVIVLRINSISSGVLSFVPNIIILRATVKTNSAKTASEATASAAWPV